MESTRLHPHHGRGVARSAGFDFTARIRPICADMTRRVPELAHIDFGRVAVSFRQARKAVSHGMYASLTPLRFAGGCGPPSAAAARGAFSGSKTRPAGKCSTS